MAPFQGCALDCTWKQRVAAEVFNLWEESRRGKSSLQLTDDFVDLCIVAVSHRDPNEYLHRALYCNSLHSLWSFAVPHTFHPLVYVYMT